MNEECAVCRLRGGGGCIWCGWWFVVGCWSRWGLEVFLSQFERRKFRSIVTWIVNLLPVCIRKRVPSVIEIPHQVETLALCSFATNSHWLFGPPSNHKTPPPHACPSNQSHQSNQSFKASTKRQALTPSQRVGAPLV
jgi:hypothetical protein